MVAFAVLRSCGVPLAQSGTFGLYVCLGISLPGTLLWRIVRRRAGLFAEDVAAGSALGYAVEVLAYIGSRWCNLPRLFLVWPLAVLAICCVVPGFRRLWRGGYGRVPTWWAWAVSVFCVVPVVWGALGFFRSHGLTWPGYSMPYGDMPDILALVGEIKHHVPPESPGIAGLPLHYHWFAYAESAGGSWATGIEIQTMVYRLSALPMMAVFAVLTAATARRLTGRWWSGPAALAIIYLVAAPDPVGPISPLIPSGAVLDSTMWVSLSQTFGAMLFAVVMLIVVEILRNRAAGGTWVPLGVLLVVLSGTKATFLPLLLAGLLVVIAVQAVLRRTHWPTVSTAGLVGVCLFAAQLVLYRDATQLLVIEPIALIQTVVKMDGLPTRAGSAGPAFAMTVILLFCWAMVWAGTAGLVRCPSARRDPAVWLLLSIGAMGAVASLVLFDMDSDELYFIQAVRPYLALAAVCGLAAAIPPTTSRRHGGLYIGAALTGGVITSAIAALSPRPLPQDPTTVVVCSYLILVAVAAAFSVAVFAVVRRASVFRNVAFPATLVLLTGLGLSADYRSRATRTYEMWPLSDGTTIPAGALRAGRWLRDHSSSDELVATNIGCTPWTAHCFSEEFWVSAYTERRVLVEGWGFSTPSELTAQRQRINPDHVPFWDRQRLADNAAAFNSPSTRTIARLRDGYGVHWLLVNGRSKTQAATSLGRYASPRFHSGQCTVYEIRP